LAEASIHLAKKPLTLRIFSIEDLSPYQTNREIGPPSFKGTVFV
jgi:hypothetical protein